MEDSEVGYLVLSRLQHGRDKLRRYRVEIDDAKMGTLGAGETKDFALPLGPHRLRLRIDWCSSPATSFELTPAKPKHDLWCCAGSAAHIEDIVVRRSEYIQLGERQDADAMPARAAFDVRHSVKLLLSVIVLAVVVGIVVAVV